jgi:hypothetical protein
VGLIQRAVESEGISTISITLSTEITRKVRPPRAIYPGFPLGHPLGYPGQIFRHLKILRLLLKYLEKIASPGTIIELDWTDHGDPAVASPACTI